MNCRMMDCTVGSKPIGSSNRGDKMYESKQNEGKHTYLSYP